MSTEININVKIVKIIEDSDFVTGSVEVSYSDNPGRVEILLNSFGKNYSNLSHDAGNHYYYSGNFCRKCNIICYSKGGERLGELSVDFEVGPPYKYSTAGNIKVSCNKPLSVRTLLRK